MRRPAPTGPRASATAFGLGAAVALGLGVAGAGAGRVVRVERATSPMVWVPAGTFTMGVTKADGETAVADCKAAIPSRLMQEQVCDHYKVLLPHLAARPVTLDGFAIDRDEVTVGAYRRCVAAGACALEPLVAGDARYLRDAGPLVNVSWWEAGDFCRWRGGRLPTEAEWERAARGDGAAVWPWGQQPRPRDFNHGRPVTSEDDLGLGLGYPDDDDGAMLLADPGSYPWGAGPYGTRDQAGNVAEWVLDTAGPAGYDDLPAVNPVRLGSATDPRVVRGGSWREPMYASRVDLRDPFCAAAIALYAPNRRFSHVGFRCAADQRR